MLMLLENGFENVSRAGVEDTFSLPVLRGFGVETACYRS
jgi:hypothetical protein